jgi:hypothetical protein
VEASIPKLKKNTSCRRARLGAEKRPWSGKWPEEASLYVPTVEDRLRYLLRQFGGLVLDALLHGVKAAVTLTYQQESH